MSDAGSAKAPDARAGKQGGNFNAPPPPDKPKEWRPLGVLQYRNKDGVFEFRVVSASTIPQELREDLHDKHGIYSVKWEAR